MDDVILLSRLQFAVAVFFHFIFVPLTLGLSLLIALMETRYVRTGDEVWRKHAKFWGKLFIINFTLGVVTGITLEFQFGTNWARYSEYVGDIFGSLLAIGQDAESARGLAFTLDQLDALHLSPAELLSWLQAQAPEAPRWVLRLLLGAAGR